jgi:glycerophosphoryl diester phosphodiesterase
MQIHGHRGSSQNYPESTLLAYRKAVEEGAHGIEMDVKKSADGVYYIMHDGTLDRTTNGTGLAKDYTWDYLSTLDAGSWKGAEFANREDTKIPRLDDLLDEFQSVDVIAVLHLSSTFGETDITNIISMITSRNMLDKIHFFGEMSGINIVKNLEPTAFTYNSGMPNLANYQQYLDNAITNSHQAVSIASGLPDSDYNAMISNIKSSGKMVHISTLGSSYSTNTVRYYNLGADILLGNDVLAMVTALPAEPPSSGEGSLGNLIKVGEYQKVITGAVKVDNLFKNNVGSFKTDKFIIIE